MNIYSEISKHMDSGTACILATVVGKSGEGPVEVGKKMIVGSDGIAKGTVGGGALEFYARERCKELLADRKNLLEKYLLNEGEVIKDAKTLPMVCGGEVSIFYEYIGPDACIYIFGGGHVGQATVNVLKTMNFHITVIDERKAVYNAFKGADRKVNMSFTEFIESEGIEEGSFIIVCTPSHKHDYNVIYKVIELGLKPQYIGMLCSPSKLNDFLSRIYKKFGKNADLSNLYSPIGLDIGGGSPEEIAISIVSEILVVNNGKTGHKHMRVGDFKW